MVVGAGPNGLAAAITLAQSKLSVLLVEANAEVGGACRSAELTLPGFIHDTCSAIHPMAVASPFFDSLALQRHGLEWIHPGFPLAHPLDGGQSVTLRPNLAAQAAELANDGHAYEKLLTPFVHNWEALRAEILQPIIHLPRKPVLMAEFGWSALQSASRLARRHFQGSKARALFAGMAAHSFLSLTQPASAAVGLVLAAAGHAAGWPMPRGGSGQITKALAAHLQGLGGKIETNRRVKNIDELPRSRALFLDLTPRQVVAVAGQGLPTSYIRALQKFRYGPAAFKLDYALSRPIPWQCSEMPDAGTVHLGGTLEEIEESERTVSVGGVAEKPFVLVTQPTLFDDTRAPQGQHIAWAYCHAPHGCSIDLTEAIENQIERFAPGFRDCVLARCARGPAALERDNANLVGGDINGGLANLPQMIARPVLGFHQYQTPLKGTYICSASTPPGGGVHGMSGHNAAMLSLRTDFGLHPRRYA